MGSLGGREVRGAPKYELMEVVQNPKSGDSFPDLSYISFAGYLPVNSHLEAHNQSLPAHPPSN